LRDTTLAYDISIFNNGRYIGNGDDADYRRAAAIGKRLGLVWGADWIHGKKLHDTDHFEYPTGLTMAQMRERVRQGRPLIAPKS
jgi:hypothetical protein